MFKPQRKQIVTSPYLYGQLSEFITLVEEHQIEEHQQRLMNIVDCDHRIHKYGDKRQEATRSTLGLVPIGNEGNVDEERELDNVVDEHQNEVEQNVVECRSGDVLPTSTRIDERHENRAHVNGLWEID